jgi:hypothetical protein
MHVSRRALLQPRTVGARSAARLRDEQCWIHVYRTAMACRVEIVLPDDNRDEVGAARKGYRQGYALDVAAAALRARRAPAAP